MDRNNHKLPEKNLSQTERTLLIDIIQFIHEITIYREGIVL